MPGTLYVVQICFGHCFIAISYIFSLSKSTNPNSDCFQSISVVSDSQKTYQSFHIFNARDSVYHLHLLRISFSTFSIFISLCPDKSKTCPNTHRLRNSLASLTRLHNSLTSSLQLHNSLTFLHSNFIIH